VIEDHAPDYYRMAQLILIGMAVQLVVIIYVFNSSYEGRKDLVNSQRLGCKRGKLDRADNARLARSNASNWRQAAGVRRADGDISVAIVYETNARKQEAVAQSLTERARINCKIVYPNAGIFP
jgi:hypothetical protein